jgi:hypothetical protein
MLRRCCTIVAAIAIAALALAQGATADPVNAKNALVVPVSCDDGQTYQVAVNGNGEFTPAHILGSTAVFIPETFDLTFEFTPTGGPTESKTETGSKHNVHGNVMTCSIDFTQVFPQGTFHLFGTVTGFATPAS